METRWNQLEITVSKPFQTQKQRVERTERTERTMTIKDLWLLLSSTRTTSVRPRAEAAIKAVSFAWRPGGSIAKDNEGIL